MKELLLQYAQYNIWANKRIIDVMQALPEEATTADIVSSFPSIRVTVLHTWSAESIWLQRLQRIPREQQVWHQLSFTGTFAEACELWEQASAELALFVEQQDEAAFGEILPFTLRSGDSAEKTVFHILQHVFNHATYHRGQLVTMLRQSGVTTLPSTDLIGFTGVKS